MGLRVYLRCYSVAGTTGNSLFHCGIIVECGDRSISYDGGGGSSSGSSDPIPKQREPADPRDDHQEGFYVAVHTKPGTPHKSCEEEMACLEKAFTEIRQVPYSVSGPNSNTYAHALLD